MLGRTESITHPRSPSSRRRAERSSRRATMRDERLHAEARAAAGSAAVVIRSRGSSARAEAASSAGSTERGFEARVTTSAPIAGTSARSMPRVSLSRMAANTSGMRCHAGRFQIGGERLRALRVVTRVEQNLAAVAQAAELEPSRPRDGLEAAHDRVGRHLESPARRRLRPGAPRRARCRPDETRRARPRRCRSHDAACGAGHGSDAQRS